MMGMFHCPDDTGCKDKKEMDGRCDKKAEDESKELCFRQGLAQCPGKCVRSCSDWKKLSISDTRDTGTPSSESHHLPTAATATW